MKRAWYCRDLKGSLADYVYLYVGYNPPTMNDAPKMLGLGEIHTGAWAGKDAGNPWLADEIMRKQPDYCFCGHIHSGNHELQEITGIHLANVSLVGEDYNIHYEPLYLNI